MWEVELRVGMRIAFSVFYADVFKGNVEVEVRGCKDDLTDVPPKGEFLAVWLDAEVVRGSDEEFETFMRKSLADDGAGIIHLCSHTNCKAMHKTRVAFHVLAFEYIFDTGISSASVSSASPQQLSEEEERRPALRLSEGPDARSVSRSPPMKRPRTKVILKPSKAAAAKKEAAKAATKAANIKGKLMASTSKRT
jgi:hypothetical protein